MGTPMTKTEQLQQDLDYIAATVRRREQPTGIPALYLLPGVIDKQLTEQV